MRYAFKRWQFWIAVFMIILGVGILSFAVYYTITDQSKLKNYNEATAVVVGYEERKSFTDDHTKYTYAEVVEYTVNGVTYRAVNDASSTSPKELGSVMRIAFNPNDPSDCVFVNTQKWLYVFLFVIGGAMTAFGIYLPCYIVKNS